MQTSRLIQTLVFVLAAVIVAVSVVSGLHFVRSRYIAHFERNRERLRRIRAYQAVQATWQARQAAQTAEEAAHRAEYVELSERVFRLTEKVGIIVQQPDGGQDIAVAVEPEATASERAELTNLILRIEFLHSDLHCRTNSFAADPILVEPRTSMFSVSSIEAPEDRD